MTVNDQTGITRKETVTDNLRGLVIFLNTVKKTVNLQGATSDFREKNRNRTARMQNRNGNHLVSINGCCTGCVVLLKECRSASLSGLTGNE
jgi:hypothetical protein